MATHQPQPATGESACPPAPRWFLTGPACTPTNQLGPRDKPPKKRQFYFTSTLHAGTLAEKFCRLGFGILFPHVLPRLKVAFSLPFA